jgi:hypothetical protein
MNPASMHYTNVLANFKIEWEDYESLIKQDEPSIPAVDRLNASVNLSFYVHENFGFMIKNLSLIFRCI